MKESDNWRKAGEVPGGKGHLLTSAVSVMGDDGMYVRAYTACNRLTHVRPVPWSDLLWEDDAWACKACRKHVGALLAHEYVKGLAHEYVKGSPAPPADPPEDSERAERLRLYVALQAIARQAAQPGPVLKSRARLIEERDQAREARRAMTEELEERGKTIRQLGVRVNRDGKELDRLNELLSTRETELQRLRADNRYLAREAAKAEVLRDVVKSIFG